MLLPHIHVLMIESSHLRILTSQLVMVLFQKIAILMQFYGWKCSEFCSKTSWSLLRGLLMRDPNHRLGSKGSNEIKGHDFFRGINWEILDRREMVSPFKPNNIDSKVTGKCKTTYLNIWLEHLNRQLINGAPLRLFDFPS